MISISTRKSSSSCTIRAYRIKEVPIPTYYGDEICYVNGMKYARDVARAVRRYQQTCRSVSCYPEFQEYFVHYPIKQSKYSSHYYARMLTGIESRCARHRLRRRLLRGRTEEERQSRHRHRRSRGRPPTDVFEQYFSADLDAGIAAGGGAA